MQCFGGFRTFRRADVAAFAAHLLAEHREIARSRLQRAQFAVFPLSIFHSDIRSRGSDIVHTLNHRLFVVVLLLRPSFGGGWQRIYVPSM